MSQEQPSQKQITGPDKVTMPDPEVVSVAKRRKFTAEYKRRILAAVDDCTKPGEIGALLRREGLYSSHLTRWRRQRRRGELRGLAAKKRGRKASEPDHQQQELTRLQRENFATLHKSEVLELRELEIGW